MLRKIEACESSAFHFLWRFKGASHDYAQSVRHAGNAKRAPIKTKTTLKVDRVPIDDVRDVYDALTKAREAAVDAADWDE